VMIILVYFFLYFITILLPPFVNTLLLRKVVCFFLSQSDLLKWRPFILFFVPLKSSYFESYDVRVIESRVIICPQQRRLY
jgi:hypothetical protein